MLMLCFVKNADFFKRISDGFFSAGKIAILPESGTKLFELVANAVTSLLKPTVTTPSSNDVIVTLRGEQNIILNFLFLILHGTLKLEQFVALLELALHLCQPW